MTQLQRDTFRAVAIAQRGGQWYRAQGSGERVTLASLFRHGLLARRARRIGASASDNAYEYKLSMQAAAELGIADLLSGETP